MPIASIDIGLIIGYIVIVMVLGFWSARKSSPDEYLIHGRSLTTFQLIATISASWIGGGAIVAYGAYVYKFGAVALILYVGVFLNTIVFARYAPAIRRRAHKLDHLTIGDYFSSTVGKNAGAVAAMVTAFAYMLFLANQFIAGSSVLSIVSGWSYDVSLFISAFVVLVYLFVGGMKSVVKTDIFQYFTMLLLIVLLGIGMIKKTGVDPVLLDPLSMSPGLAIAFILYGLFIPFSSVEVWQRIYAAKDDRSIKRGLIGSGFCILILGASITLLGLAARTAYPDINPNNAIAYGMVNLLPAGLLGLGLVVLFAAIMSTVDTVVFYLASSIAKDYFGRLPKNASRERMASITRIYIVIVTMIGILLSYFFRDIISVIITISGVISGMVPPIIGSFFMKLKEKAVIASMLSACVYIALLMAVGLVKPDYAMGSLLVSALVLVIWQKWGK